jgi:hypothetical protein
MFAPDELELLRFPLLMPVDVEVDIIDPLKSVFG